MNLTDLKYVIEIDKRGSISQTAKEIYIAQPNLSKAIKNLENEFQIQIFDRSSKGVKATREGQTFLEHARRVIQDVEELCDSYGKKRREKLNLRICVPRASYIAHAFAEYVSQLDEQMELDMDFRETSTMTTIDNVGQNGYNLGIIRYQRRKQEDYQSLLQLRNLEMQVFNEFDYLLLTSADGELAQKDFHTPGELSEGVEILHGDSRLPNGEYIEFYKEGREAYRPKKKIYIFERGSQFDILREVKNSYMWVSPMPENILERYHLVQKEVGFPRHKMRDALVYKKGYVINQREKEFLEHLKRGLKKESYRTKCVDRNRLQPLKIKG